MRRALWMLAYCFVTTALVIGLTVFLSRFAPNQAIGEIRYVDLISIVLTALSIMITILGLFGAALGVIGWATFESKLRDNSFSYLTAELSKDGKLRKEFETILTEISLRGVRPEESEPNEPDHRAPESPYND